jgi:2'-5' RNA ligase
MPEVIRSFIAFDVNDESVRKRMGDVQSLLVRTRAHLKLVQPQNIHVTLRFLGNITPNTVGKIFDEMKKVQFTPFDVIISGLGAFLTQPRFCAGHKRLQSPLDNCTCEKRKKQG